MASSRRGHSKAQMCFFKILRIISSTPPSPKTKGINIDLNLTFSSQASTAPQQQQQQQEQQQQQQQPLPVHVSDDEAKRHAETESEETAAAFGESNCLDLLIEAARVLDESDSEGGESRTRRGGKRWVVVDLYGADVAEEREPVVRSKRGRNQALPCRLRDSVVEPLKRATRSQRPTSTPQLAKRLLRSSSTT